VDNDKGSVRTDVKTWHYGVVAKWWAEFNVGGPEVSHFRDIIREAGEPVLDVGCGTGRLLLEYLGEGIDVDGADVSPDMLAYCRKLGDARGMSPRLVATPMQELEVDRKYRTI
jgi:SAM-dependent methyltransferase